MRDHVSVLYRDRKTLPLKTWFLFIDVPLPGAPDYPLSRHAPENAENNTYMPVATAPNMKDPLDNVTVSHTHAKAVSLVIPAI